MIVKQRWVSLSLLAVTFSFQLSMYASPVSTLSDDKIFAGDLSQCQVILVAKKPTRPYGSPWFNYISPDQDISDHPVSSGSGPGCHLDRGFKLCLLTGSDYAQIPSRYREVADNGGTVEGWQPQRGAKLRVKILKNSIESQSKENPYLSPYQWGRCSRLTELFKKDKTRIAKESLEEEELFKLEGRLMAFAPTLPGEDTVLGELSDFYDEHAIKGVDENDKLSKLQKSYIGIQGAIRFLPEQFEVKVNPKSPIPGLNTWKVGDATLTYPLFADATISGPFYEKRKRKRHLGIDFGTGGAPSPVFAVADAEVIKVDQCTTKQRGKCGAGFGNHIDLFIPQIGCVVRYAHLNPKCLDNKMTNIKEGQKVRYGDHIACVGNTGISSAPHLHFEVNCQKEMAHGSSPLKARISDYRRDGLYITNPEKLIKIDAYKIETEYLQYY